MLGLNKLFRKQRMNFVSKALQAPSEASKIELVQLKILQMVTQQVVLSVEGTVRLPGGGKKALAVELVGKILEEMKLVAPDSLVDALIESAVSILKALDKANEKAAASKISFDISGRPKTGNT